ncbi:MAG: hypothetical protein JXR63_04945 [Spirochaetales bacterium]|nr:hypothetical protein [Spirochaetales bacterium]
MIPRCTRPTCVNFYNPRGDWYKEAGTYSNNSGTYRRFYCKDCGKWFSERTFSIHHYSHYEKDFKKFAKDISETSSMRALARKYNHSVQSILLRIMKLSRHCLAASCIFEENLHLREDLVSDGIENFVKSKHYPCDYNILVGQDSQYLYGFTWSLMRSKMKKTEAQKAKFNKMKEGVDYNTFTISEGFNALFQQMLKIVGTKEKFDDSSVLTILDTDKKTQYANVIKKSVEAQELIEKNEFRHDVTSSKCERNRSNRLFAVNYMERELRKGLKEMVRDTVCGAKNVCMSLDRFSIFAFDHNTQKKFRINDPVSDTHVRHAHIAGLDAVLIYKYSKKVFTERFFYSDYKKKLNPFQTLMWLRKIPTPQEYSKQFVPNYALI